MKETTRVQMELNDKALTRLKSLKEKTEAVSYAEVTKNAYRIYEKLIDLHNNGYRIVADDGQGGYHAIDFFM